MDRVMPARLSKSASALTFEEWYAKPVVQPLTSSQPLGWNDIALHTSRLKPTDEYMQSPVTENHFLLLLVKGSTQIRTKWGGKFHNERQTAGSLHLHPAGNESEGSWSSSVTVAFVELSPRLIVGLADTAFRGDPAHVQLLPRLNFRDPLLQYLSTELYNELQNPGLLGTLFVESAAQTIMLHLLRKYSTTVIALREPHTQLNARQIRILNEYIDHHLDQKISLSDLAAQLHLSVSHFERSFRASVGCPPYRYVLERRMERAQQLLGSSKLSVYEIARACGFANQSHFTRHFTQFAGISPARFAALAKS